MTILSYVSLTISMLIFFLVILSLIKISSISSELEDIRTLVEMKLSLEQRVDPVGTTLERRLEGLQSTRFAIDMSKNLRIKNDRRTT